MRISARRLALAVAVVALTGAGCEDEGPRTQLEQLEEHEALWAATRPVAYRFALERICFCAERGPVRVTVEGQTVMDRTFVETGDPVEGEARSWFPDVDGLFDVLRHALESGADHVDVEYDPQTGVPIDLWIDYAANVADEELGFHVTESVTPAS